MGKSCWKSVAAGAVALLVSVAAQAEAVYQFSYTFAGNRSGLSNVLVTGTVQGVSDGLKVSGIHNITLSWTHNGVTTDFTGPLSIFGYYSGASPDILRDEQQMWFDRDSNNFFINNYTGCNFTTDTGCVAPADAQGFLLRNGQGGGDEDGILVDGGATISDDGAATNTWSLRYLRDADPSTSVSAPGTLALVGAAAVALGLTRRRRAARGG